MLLLLNPLHGLGTRHPAIVWRRQRSAVATDGRSSALQAQRGEKEQQRWIHFENLGGAHRRRFAAESAVQQRAR